MKWTPTPGSWIGQTVYPSALLPGAMEKSLLTSNFSGKEKKKKKQLYKKEIMCKVLLFYDRIYFKEMQGLQMNDCIFKKRHHIKYSLVF